MVNLRLKELRTSLNMSQKMMGDVLGIAQTTYANYESGKANIPDELKTKLYNEFSVNLNWLLTGSGRKFISRRTQNAQDVDYYIDLIEKNDLTNYVTPSGKTYPIQLSHGGLSVPILASRVSAGNGEEWSIEDIREDERLPILARFIKPYDKEKIFAAEVRGDSMTGIQLFDGDFVFAVKGLTEGDGIYVISIDGEIFVKRVEYDPFEKKLRIISENERYQDKVVDSDRVILVGKVIGWLHHHPY